MGDCCYNLKELLTPRHMLHSVLLRRLQWSGNSLDQPPCSHSQAEASMTVRQVPLEQNFLNCNQADAPSDICSLCLVP